MRQNLAMQSLVFLDVETTGLDSRSADLLELAAVRFSSGKIQERFESLIRPFSPVPLKVQKLTGISNQMAQGAPDLQSVRRDFLENFLLPGDTFVAHNAAFDLGFLREKNFTLNHPAMDTLALAQILLPECRSFALEFLTAKFGIKHEDSHRAMSDTLATLELFQILQKVALEKFSADFWDRAKGVLKKSLWDSRFFFSSIFKKFSQAQSDLDLGTSENEPEPEKAEKRGVQQISLFQIAAESPRTQIASEQHALLPEVSISQRAAEKQSREAIVEPAKQEQEIATQLAGEMLNNAKLLAEIPPTTNPLTCAILAAVQCTKGGNKKVGVLLERLTWKDFQNVEKSFAHELALGEVEAEFFAAKADFICREKFEKFLKMPSFTAAETSLILKILQNEKEEFLHAGDLRLTGAELNVAQRELLGCAESCQERCCPQLASDCHLVLAPQKDWESLPVDIFICTGGSQLASTVTGNFQKAANPRIFADFFTNFFEKESKQPNKEKREMFTTQAAKFREGLEFGFNLIANFVRSKFPPSDFPQSLQVGPAEENSKEFSDFLAGFVHGKIELAGLWPDETFLKNELEKWIDFFQVSSTSNELKVLTAFPDGQVSCARLPVDLREDFQQMFAGGKSVAILGRNFQKSFANSELGGKPNLQVFLPGFDFQSFENDFDFSGSIFFANSDLKNGDEKNSEKIAQQIFTLASQTPGNVCCALGSQKIVESVFEDLKRIFKKELEKVESESGTEVSKLLRRKGITFTIFPHISGSPAKTEIQFANESGKKILLFPIRQMHKFTGLDFAAFFLQKFDFAASNDLVFEARKGLFANDFLDFVLPHAAQSFLAFLHFAMRHNTTGRFAFCCGDPRVLRQNSWGRHFFDALPEGLPKKFLPGEKIPTVLQTFFAGKDLGES